MSPVQRPELRHSTESSNSRSVKVAVSMSRASYCHETGNPVQHSLTLFISSGSVWALSPGLAGGFSGCVMCYR